MGNLSEYATAKKTIADSVGDTIDSYTYGGLKKAYRGSLQVAASGFGKGLLITVAAVTVASVVATVIWPATMLGASFAGAGVATCVNEGLMLAGNFLLGTGAGFITMLVGSTVGSLAAAHSENAHMGKEIAESKAQYYKLMRSQPAPAIQPEKQIEAESCGCEHRDRLAHERGPQQEIRR